MIFAFITLCNVYVCLSRDLYFKRELHRIHRKTCLMGFSIGLRLPVLDINRTRRRFDVEIWSKCGRDVDRLNFDVVWTSPCRRVI